MTPQLDEALRLLRLAERDRDVFEILAGFVATGTAHAAAGFHAQQAVEKALKALLCLRDIDFPRTHDLESLINRLAGSGSIPPYAASHLRPLTPYAVDFATTMKSCPCSRKTPCAPSSRRRSILLPAN
jgi:HEPN domain-containing protein